MEFKEMIATLLTISMFVMLGNMIKKEHIDPFFTVNDPASFDMQKTFFTTKVLDISDHLKDGVYMMRPCWKKFSALKNQREQMQGLIFFSLTNDPEYHALQVADAIFIARHLGAVLVLPDIRGIEAENKRTFGEVYDIKNFMTSLHDVVQVVIKNQSSYRQEGEKITTVELSKRVTKEFVSSKIEPLFKNTKQVRFLSHYSSSTLVKAYETSDDDFINPYACLALFESLRLKPELQELVDMMVRTLKFLSVKASGGKFIALDLRVEDIETNMRCKKTNDTASEKSCFGVHELCKWLYKIGFSRKTTIYITQTRWHKSLQPLKKAFPNTFTKDSLIPFDMKTRYLDRNNFEYERYIDLYLCARSNIFVPTSSNLFYASVSGMRIGLGNTNIMVPPLRSSFTPATKMSFLSPYILNKSHIAYSCLCA